MEAAFDRRTGQWETFGWDEHGRAERGWRRLDGVVCADLVAKATVGRIAFTHQALPVVLPVALRSPTSPMRFEVGDGALLDAARLAQVVCFQTDSGDVGEGSWSVAIVGHLSVHSEWPDVAGAPVALIELNAELVTGRCREPVAP
ncbi:MAG TPA: pyridoxamine 5'-phosphate oxidase family protein [Ilumatobacter sp.]|nr:pyridoxamine 5'-phosphate oxidase family protein [Ilumatobacter sp.]